MWDKAADLALTKRPHPAQAGRDWLRLIRSRRVGPATFHRLLAEYGSARAALEALPQIARAAGVAGYTLYPEAAVEAEFAAARAAGAVALYHGTAEYPPALMALGDAPPLLWARGDLALLAQPGLAVVGARNLSSLGMRMAQLLASGLGAAGYVLISGLARGVDAAAHAAALPSGTIAVVAGGVDQPYPSETAALMAQIAARGLIVSEQPMGLIPQARHFPLRNRIIAGLSQAVVVVEAAARSGALITARAALDLGREVMAVPGHPFDARAVGCNHLIRDGAALVRHAEDVLQALGVEAAQGQPQPQRPVRAEAAALTAARSKPAATQISVAQNSCAQNSSAQSAPRQPCQPQIGQMQISQPQISQPQNGPSDLGQMQTGPMQAGQQQDPPARDAPPQELLRHAPLKLADRPPRKPVSQALRLASALHSQILARLTPSPLAEDQLLRDLDLPAAEGAEALLSLELEGQITRQAGGLIARG